MNKSSVPSFLRPDTSINKLRWIRCHFAAFPSNVWLWVLGSGLLPTRRGSCRSGLGVHTDVSCQRKFSLSFESISGAVAGQGGERTSAAADFLLNAADPEPASRTGVQTRPDSGLARVWRKTSSGRPTGTPEALIDSESPAMFKAVPLELHYMQSPFP